MYLTENLQEKWQPVLEHPDLPKIGDSYKRAVTTVILENQEKAVREDQSFMAEAAPANATGSSVDNWDPVLISLVRRAMPNLIAYDICGVQPMTGPTGLIFAMKSRYATQGGTEALFDEADTDFSAEDAASNTGSPDAHAGSNPATLNDSPSAGTYTTGSGMTTAEAELANILSTEILAEINREVIRTIYKAAESGAQANVANAGKFDLDVDSNGRWSVEKFKGLIFQIERDANAIAQRTRRGKGNMILCSADVASALTMAGVLDYTPALNANLNVDDTGNTFAGILQGKYKVYIDPYSANVAANQYYVVGYKGSSPYDAGLFYCPYVPLQMVRAVGENTFQPKIGFKTRYGLVANPFAEGTTAGQGRLKVNSNRYYRRVQVQNLM